MFRNDLAGHLGHAGLESPRRLRLTAAAVTAMWAERPLVSSHSGFVCPYTPVCLERQLASDWTPRRWSRPRSNLLRDMCGGMGAPFLGSDDSLRSQRSLYGLVDDDSWIVRSVLGATLSVSLGLFTVALCHYLGVARLMLALSSTEPSCRASYTWMYPAYTYAVSG